MLASVVTLPLGKMCTVPATSRRTLVRNVTVSTTPPVPLTPGPGPVAQAEGADRARPAPPAGTVDHRHVAHPHLILEHEEESGDDVAHDVLRPEADGRSDDAGTGQDRPAG